MAKNKTVYVCQNCGAESPKWIGHCTACKEWNTYREELIALSSPSSISSSAPRRKAELLPGIEVNESDTVIN